MPAVSRSGHFHLNLFDIAVTAVFVSFRLVSLLSQLIDD